MSFIKKGNRRDLHKPNRKPKARGSYAQCPKRFKFRVILDDTGKAKKMIVISTKVDQHGNEKGLYGKSGQCLVV